MKSSLKIGVRSVKQMVKSSVDYNEVINFSADRTNKLLLWFPLRTRVHPCNVINNGNQFKLYHKNLSYQEVNLRKPSEFEQPWSSDNREVGTLWGTLQYYNISIVLIVKTEIMQMLTFFPLDECEPTKLRKLLYRHEAFHAPLGCIQSKRGRWQIYEWNVLHLHWHYSSNKTSRASS